MIQKKKKKKGIKSQWHTQHYVYMVRGNPVPGKENNDEQTKREKKYRINSIVAPHLIH